MKFYVHIKSFLGWEKTIELLGGWIPLCCKGKVKKIKNWWKNQNLLSVDQKKEFEMTPALKKEGPVESTSSRSIQGKAQRTSEEADRSQEKSRQRQLAHTLPTRVQDPQIRAFSHGQCIQYGQTPYRIQSQGSGKDEQDFIKRTVDQIRYN
ncbi:hypothetical protein O181_114394 [Austropuccinia psidii MF-1]|uniref:Uncharacterized protein n=1 Tax=Austropuccinia psidii MF-1 TaxID=1389203 RepID=A0A9Q3K599_9BASI|nr:hypothetical protein [Austropuccinia psidii MF-1]